ncbi:phosphatase PAP2 family protein [Kitasatospora sp. NPDC059571]|uniref:phosphatase PAP2 family protein n=1 Tax=Kitasatospora sp. NPDC059571 TaxID=3346871 RepID=UPI0036929DF3
MPRVLPSRADRHRLRSSPRRLTALVLLAVLGVCGPVTWHALGAPAGRPAPLADVVAAALGGWSGTGTRAVLTAAALAAVTVIAVRLARDPPPGLPLPGAVGALAAGALLTGADLRGVPIDAVLGVCCLALVLTEVLGPGRGAGGAALGTAIALEPVLLLFAALAAVRGERRRALTAVLVAGALDLAVWSAAPGPTLRSWRRLADPLLAAGPDNQSAYGLLFRLGLHGPPLLVLWALIAAVVAGAAVRRGAGLAADGQRLLAAGVVGCAAITVAPLTGPAGLGWLLAAAVGRIGRRPEDRVLWPVVAVALALLPGRLFDPGIEPVTSFLLRGAPALAAPAAAAVLPFRRSADPLWSVRRAPGPTPHRPFGLPFLPLLPARMRPVSRPDLLLELLFVQVGYGIYSWIRNAAPDRAATAIANAQDIRRAEAFLHIDVERTLNRLVLRSEGLLDASLEYYKILHLIVPVVVLAWLYLRHPDRYRAGRTVLFTATGLALVGFWGYPLAPPRLTPGAGLRDTAYGAPDTAPTGVLTDLTNQYAAMPSLHIAWALWCTLAVLTATRRRWLRVLAPLYPAVTLAVVVATANHWLADAAGALAVVLAGCLVQYALTGRRLSEPVALRVAVAGPAPPGGAGGGGPGPPGGGRPPGGALWPPRGGGARPAGRELRPAAGRGGRPGRRRRAGRIEP